MPGLKQPIRCPECGDIVESFFDHVDQDCTGNYPEAVAKGHLKPQNKKEQKDA